MNIQDLLADLFRSQQGAAQDGPGEMVRSALATGMPQPLAMAPRPLSAPAMAGGPKTIPTAAAPRPVASEAPSMPKPQQRPSFVPSPLSTFSRGYGEGGLLGAIGNLTEEPQRLQMAADEQRRAEAAAASQKNMTYKALIAKGVDPAIAQAALANPQIMKEVISNTFGVAKPTDDMREYEYAKSQGFTGSFMDFERNRRKAGAASTIVNMTQENAYDKEIGGLLAKDFIAAQEKGGVAQRDLSNLAVMESALKDPNLYTGTGGNVIQGVKKAASTLFGVDVKGVSSGEVMQNLGNEIAVANKSKLPGPMSDADRQFLVDMAPNLTKTPAGNQSIIQLGMAHKRWEVARAKALRDYAGRNGGRLDTGVYGLLSTIDAEAADEIGSIMSSIKSMELPTRSPTVGTPLGEDPLGIRR